MFVVVIKHLVYLFWFCRLLFCYDLLLGDFLILLNSQLVSFNHCGLNQSNPSSATKTIIILLRSISMGKMSHSLDILRRLSHRFHEIPFSLLVFVFVLIIAVNHKIFSMECLIKISQPGSSFQPVLHIEFYGQMNHTRMWPYFPFHYFMYIKWIQCWKDSRAHSSTIL